MNNNDGSNFAFFNKQMKNEEHFEKNNMDKIIKMKKSLALIIIQEMMMMMKIFQVYLVLC